LIAVLVAARARQIPARKIWGSRSGRLRLKYGCLKVMAPDAADTLTKLYEFSCRVKDRNRLCL
jgi:hypothetical protein